MEKLIKPVKPIYPDIKDKGRYPLRTKSMRDMSLEEIENIPYIRDCKKYKKDKEKYDIDIALYDQRKAIQFIKVANERLCMKHYTITKNK